jgi:hypothetical protein
LPSKKKIKNFPVRAWLQYNFFWAYIGSGIPLLLHRGSQASNPAIVTLEGAAKDQLLSHDRSLGDDGRGRPREERG